MNVSSTMAPNKVIITHRYAVTTENASLCIFFTRGSFSRNVPYRRGTSGTPQALDRPGDDPDHSAHEGAGHEAAEKCEPADDQRLQSGGERALEVAAEARRAAVECCHPEQLVDDRQHHAVGEADGREGEEGVGDP